MVKESDDYQHEYSLAIMWEGLQHLARRDAIREGDGDRIVTHWKEDLMKFTGYCMVTTYTDK